MRSSCPRSMPRHLGPCPGVWLSSTSARSTVPLRDLTARSSASQLIPTRVLRTRTAVRMGGFLACAITLWSAYPADAFPYFARRYDVGCQTCHSIVPKLNETGLAFREQHYRLEGPTRSTIPFAGGFAPRFENRSSDGVADAYLKIVKAVTAGSLGRRASYVVKWHALDRTLDENGRLVDRSGVFEDLFLNVDIDRDLRLTVGQFRVFNQFDSSRQLSASLPVALGLGVPGDDADSRRMTDLRGFSPAMRTPAVMLSYHTVAPGAERPTDGLYFHGSIPFSGEFSLPSTDRARREASSALEGRPKGLFLEAYHRLGLRTIGASTFVDFDRQFHTAMFSIDPGQWATSIVFSQVRFEGEGTRRVSWWGEYRPNFKTNLGLRLDEPGGIGVMAATVYADRQWFTERAMVWVLLEQRLSRDSNRTVAQIKLVF